ncbi:MAG: hypothetical protein K5663_10975 [Clostridiales bacterium]|nr:hypothetical protein [Clostridiales bacterium]
MQIHIMENRKPRFWASFGGYWPRGAVSECAFTLTNSKGQNVPLQSEIAAWWPDGSVKWSRHIAPAGLMGDICELSHGIAPEPEGLSLSETPNKWGLACDSFSLDIPKNGDCLASGCVRDGSEVFSRVYPVLQLASSQAQDGALLSRTRALPAKIVSRAVETAGTLETVFRFDGVHMDGPEEKMPFRIRMSVRRDGEIVFDDTFFYSGEPDKDMLSGWGLRFETAMDGLTYQRHIRFLTDGNGFHDMPTQLFHWKKRLGKEPLQAQMNGETVPQSELFDAAAADLPVWDRFLLTQDSDRHFVIAKQTRPDCCVLEGVHGSRAPGAMALSDTKRTICFSLREFWEKHPAGLEASGLGREVSACTLWFYSPEAKSFDFRHYDTRSYPMGNYEGFDYVRPDPNGIAVTCRASVWQENGYMSDEALKARSDAVRRPAVYLAEPEYYHFHRAFGYWSLPRYETEVQKWTEAQMIKAFEFYETEVENRSWYGLFNYGDFMHTYEASRHMWRWDVGGFAWDNTELTPTYWLWLMFLRSGSERVFRLAEALSRHAADVDMYHFGYMGGLGSRHNVRHWGCPCKEPRVSMAGHHRPLYYLTGERRIGDCMEDSLGAAGSLASMPWYMREDGKVHLRSGPDWAALVSGWMCAYERTRDEKWRTLIEKGVNDLSKTPLGLTSGPEYGFDAATGHLIYTGETPKSGMHLQACMGETQVWLETADMLDCDELRRMVAKNGLFFYLPREDRIKLSGGLLSDREFGSPIYSAEMQAWAAKTLNDSAMARTIWKNLLSLLYSKDAPDGYTPVGYAVNEDGSELREIPWLTTNFTSQWFLKLILTLEFIPEAEFDSFEALDRALEAQPSGFRLYGA